MTDDRAIYDPMAPETIDDPFPAYAALRDRCPVHRTDQFGHPMYTVSRATTVHAVLSDTALWSNRLGPGVGYADPTRIGDVQHFDPPEHTERRRFLKDEFAPSRVVTFGEETRALAHRLVDNLEERGRTAELHDEYALPLPIITFLHMVGVSEDDRSRIKAWADQSVLGLGDPYAVGRSASELHQYIAAMVTERRRLADEAGVPGEEAVGTVIPAGLLSRFSLRLFRGERLPVEQVANMFNQLMVAGHETTTSLITNMVWRLLEERARWEQVVADPSLAEIAVEESLRFDPPVLGLCRTNTTPTRLGEAELPVDTKVMVLYASANRDEALFNDPESFRLDRDLMDLAHHYSFGWGTHHCLGAKLARQTGRIALEVLVERLPGLRLAGETERIAPTVLWGRRRLPVAW